MYSSVNLLCKKRREINSAKINPQRDQNWKSVDMGERRDSFREIILKYKRSYIQIKDKIF